jgi:hypothetical protein
MAARPSRSDKAEGRKREAFIQPLTAVIRNRGQLTPAALLVYLDLHTYDWDGEGTWVGQKTIADDLGISERTVRDAVKKLQRSGAIECQLRPGRSNVYKVKYGWVPADPSSICLGDGSRTTPATPAASAGVPGLFCRTPRQSLPHTPAGDAAETDPTNHNQKPEARTDWVPPPAASEEPLSGTTSEVSQEPTQEEPATPVAKQAEYPSVSFSKISSATSRSSTKDLTECVADIDYHSARLNPAEEALVVELATRFNHIQTVIGREKAEGIRWEKFLIGFRMILFSDKHGRSFEDVCLVLDYLSDNPTRAKEIINKDKKRGVTNTYHLMFLFDRLHREALGLGSEAEKMFSKRKVPIPDPVPSA